MPIVAEQYEFVIGVDTHAASHTISIIDTVTGRVVVQAKFPSSPAGLSRAVAWTIRETGPVGCALVVVEGIGSYGAQLARSFFSAGFEVAEAGAMPRAHVSNPGKSDALDSERIAKSVLGIDTSHLRIPRADGVRNALRILVVAREQMTSDKSAAVNSLTALVRSQGLGVDARQPLTVSQIREIASWRRRAGDTIDTRIAREEATRLARNVFSLTKQAAANARQLESLVQQSAPELLDMQGVGPVTAAIVIISWSHHGRVRSEAAFAALAGTCPIPASSGNTQRHRLNRGGDRRLNWAIHTIVMVRMGRDPETKAYIARRMAEGKTKKEAMRCAKRYLTRNLHRILKNTPALAA